MYRHGKSTLTNDDLVFVEYSLKIKSRTTTLKYLSKLRKLNFIVYNKTTQYYIFKSFDRIRKENDLINRLAYPFTYSDLDRINAITGAVIYSYLHKDFWRKVKREKVVHLKGSTYFFLSHKFNYKKHSAPVSVNGVKRLFEVSKSTASRLKNEATNCGLIKLTKNYSIYAVDKKAMQEYLKYNDYKQTVVYKDGIYRLQLIDTILPLFYFTKRNSLET